MKMLIVWLFPLLLFLIPSFNTIELANSVDIIYMSMVYDRAFVSVRDLYVEVTISRAYPAHSSTWYEQL